MAKGIGEAHKQVVKKTSQGGRIKTSTLNKTEKRSFKKYRGQGK
jgi:hypothetical protein